MIKRNSSCNQQVLRISIFFQEDEPTKYEKENVDLNNGKPNCTGSITVYTKPKLRGDSLTTEESLHQVKTNKQL
jgi:hypothetical protein